MSSIGPGSRRDRSDCHWAEKPKMGPHHTQAATLLALLLYLAMLMNAGWARTKYKVKAPAVAGNEQFERAYRIQMNTLEQLVFFLPSMWLWCVVPARSSAHGLSCSRLSSPLSGRNSTYRAVQICESSSLYVPAPETGAPNRLMKASAPIKNRLNSRFQARAQFPGRRRCRA